MGNCGKSQKIVTNSILKTMTISFLKKIVKDRIAGGIPKNNGYHFGGEIVAVFGGHHFCEYVTFSFLHLRYRGGLGHGLYPTKPLSNFLSNIFLIYHNIYQLIRVSKLLNMTKFKHSKLTICHPF